MLEMDLALTKDEVVVVIHDKYLDRLCGIRKRVNFYNYDELPQFLPKISLHFSEKQYFYSESSQKCNYIPKLEVFFKKINSLWNF